MKVEILVTGVIYGRIAARRGDQEMDLKSLLIAISMALAGATLVVAPNDADARRLGGGRPAGMQRQAPPPAKQADPTPAQPAQPAQAGNAAAAQPAQAGAAQGAAAGTAARAAGQRSWMAPIAGLAAGLGIAALASHFGFGELLANIVTMALLTLLAMLVIGWLLRRFAARTAPGSMRLAGAGGTLPRGFEPAPLRRESLGAEQLALPASGGASMGSLPTGLDAAEFERVAKLIFIRMQAANDAGNVDDLRKFTTPELFASLRNDLLERAAGSKHQHTDVVQLHANVHDSAREDGQWVVSVRFTGLIREEEGDAPAQPFDELWHLVKPVDGGREWAIAGITPVS